MGVVDYLRTYGRIFRLVKKPTRDDYLLTLRIVALGLGLLGALGFAFQLVGSTLQFAGFRPVSRDVAILVLAGSVAVIMGFLAYLRRRVGGI